MPRLLLPLMLLLVASPAWAAEAFRAATREQVEHLLATGIASGSSAATVTRFLQDRVIAHGELSQSGPSVVMTARFANIAAADFKSALHILAPRTLTWSPPVVTFSALTGDGIDGLWAQVLDHKLKMTATGELAGQRRAQQVKWMWTLLEERLTARLRGDPAVRAKVKQAEAAVAAGKLAPTLAVEEIAALLGV